MSTIVEAWLDFAKDALPKNCSDIQKNEMRRCFYAGFLSAILDNVDHLPLLKSKTYMDEGQNFIETLNKHN